MAVSCRLSPPRDIEVVTVSGVWPVVMVSALWILPFRCRFPSPKFGVFRHWFFVFDAMADRAARAIASASSSVIFCHSSVADVGVEEGQAEYVGLAKLGIAGSAGFSDLHETEGHDFPNGRSYGVTVNAV